MIKKKRKEIVLCNKLIYIVNIKMTVRMSSPKLRIAPLSEVFNAGLLAQLSLLAECCQSILTFLSHLSTSLLLVNFKVVSQPLCEPQCDTIGGATETTVGLTPNRTDRPV